MGISNLLILGVPISVINMEIAVSSILVSTKNKLAQYVCVRDVHGLMRAVHDPELMNIHRFAGIVTPDGMPLVWVSNLRLMFSRPKVGRVCGSDLLDAVCKAGQKQGVRHYFYGGKAGVAEAMIRNLKARHGDLCVAGFYSPPFRTLTEDEDAAVVDAINRSGADIVWVGLSTPKQEYWMRDHVGRIKGATLVGVGAAFDFHSGAVARAPAWMQNAGLEWLHRLASEPRRLWYRYLVIAPSFAFNVICEEIGLRFARLDRKGDARLL